MENIHPELLNLPADGRELALFESFEGLEIPEEPKPVVTVQPPLPDMVKRYNFNWNNKHFDWTFRMPNTKLV
ncbi:MAG: hypothetical protein KME55_22630 [Nostoc indistinguendum CM1-VF10]|jgi:hypothetical protein|nr:hypothetical protein [Nostoc indistinguendum CM1-VF10]